MASIPAEIYALANAFLFALHYIFTKEALRFSNPATGVISSLLIKIIFPRNVNSVRTMVIPLSSTGPLFSLILTAIFLRDVERVTLRIVISASMIVSGVALISWWK